MKRVTERYLDSDIIIVYTSPVYREKVHIINKSWRRRLPHIRV